MNDINTYQYDHNTGEENVREANEEELELLVLGKKGMEERHALIKKNEALRKSALEKLTALGLTPEEIAAL